MCHYYKKIGCDHLHIPMKLSTESGFNISIITKNFLVPTLHMSTCFTSFCFKAMTQDAIHPLNVLSAQSHIVSHTYYVI